MKETKNPNQTETNNRRKKKERKKRDTESQRLLHF